MESQRSIPVVPSDASKINRGDFPKDFIFGAASAAYQIEGGASEGGRGPSIWDTFTHKEPGKIMGGGNGNVAVDSYHRYKEDVKILKNMGLDAYRFSISWSRVLPGGNLNAGVNREGIDYYNNLIDELLANDIQPYVTLFHFDVPQALEDKYGGFLSCQIVDDFRQYAELCFWEFGDRVKHWITLNEPWTFSSNGYANGTAAPGRGGSATGQAEDMAFIIPCRGFPWSFKMISRNGNPGTEPYIATHNQLLAHAAAVESYKNKFQKFQEGKIGITLVTEWFEPLDENKESDIEASRRAFDFMFGWFMEPLTTGDYPESMRKFVGSRLPQFSTEQSRQLKGSYDFLGLNYYTATYATTASKYATGGKLSYTTDLKVTYATERNGVPIGPTAGSSWLSIYPAGFRKVLNYVKATYNVPLIYITENGVDEVNDTSLTLSEALVDKTRIKYMQDHLLNLKLAIDDGVNVKGYFTWALMDNFEWGEGYTVRFGLVHVDYTNNYARYPKDSAIWFMNSFHKKYPKDSARRSVVEDKEDPGTKKRQRK